MEPDFLQMESSCSLLFTHEQKWDIYSANVDGSNVKKIIDGGKGNYEFSGVDAY